MEATEAAKPETQPSPIAPTAPPVSQAAPLLPPATPEPPAPDFGPPPKVRDVVTPGSQFVDIMFGDTNAPADPAELFADPGEQYTYVLVARPLVRLQYQPGTVAPSATLMYPAGFRLARDHAAHIRGELEALRASQAAADEGHVPE